MRRKRDRAKKEELLSPFLDEMKKQGIDLNEAGKFLMKARNQ